MYAIHYYEHKTEVLNLLSRTIPSIDEQVKIKGRNGKVISVLQIKENVYQVFIEFEKVVDKRKIAANDFGNKKRR